MTKNEKNVSLKTSISTFTFRRSLSTLIKCEEISLKYEEQNISFGTKSYFSVLLLTVLLCIFFYQPLYPAMYFDINFSVIIILLVFGRKRSSSLKGKFFLWKHLKVSFQNHWDFDQDLSQNAAALNRKILKNLHIFISSKLSRLMEILDNLV